jgi:putative transposase
MWHGFQSVLNKPGACQPLAGGGAEAPPPDPRASRWHPEGVPAVIIMPATYLSLHYHLVFSTKERAALIEQSWRSRLHEYLGGTVAGLEGFPQRVGGTADHVHLLVGLKATHCLADFMRELKKASSAWVHDQIGLRRFAWQEGYAAFTVSATARAAVQRYIANQEAHHRKRTFREELVELLEKAGVEYDARYLD